jgi:hypothetical protein
MPNWTKNTGTHAQVKAFILDNLWQNLPRPPFTQETESVAGQLYGFAWHGADRARSSCHNSDDRTSVSGETFL